MISYFRESYFKDIVTRIPINEQRRIFTASLNESFDIFLSYNIYDKDVVKGIYYVLTKMGFKVYVDFIVDPSMNRSKVTKETAQRIQSRLKHSKSLICPIIECSNEQMDAMGAWSCRWKHQQMLYYAYSKGLRNHKLKTRIFVIVSSYWYQCT